jgi:hypothetical protein
MNHRKTPNLGLSRARLVPGREGLASAAIARPRCKTRHGHAG